MATIVLDGASTETTETDPELLDSGDDITVVLPSSTEGTTPSLESLTDTDVTETVVEESIEVAGTVEGIEDKSLLMYQAATSTWVPSKYLDEHTMEAGHY